MSDLSRYIASRKRRDWKFAEGHEGGYRDFKLGVVLKQIRESRGISQAELAARLKTGKSAISRIENHADDIRLSTLEKIARALGQELRVQIVPQ